MTKWIKCEDRLPSENGKYLIVGGIFNRPSVDVCRFAKNLHELDEYDFPTQKRPGWQKDDPEIGYYEIKVTYWAELPELPEDLRT